MRNYEILPEDVVLENEKSLLSRREMEILILIAAGFENYQIAQIFRVTLSTTKKQIEKIYEKLNAQNRANAVFLACCHNLISPRDYNLILQTCEVAEFLKLLKNCSDKY